MAAVIQIERIDWAPVLERAVEIVGSYDTPVTLRQLFYRLVAAGLIPNNVQSYKRLSSLTAAARRLGEFPRLADAGRTIHRRASWSSPRELLEAATQQYRRDRTEGQPAALYIGVEKNTLVAQLESWFDELGIPVLPLRGYSSESYERDIAEDVSASADGRTVIVLYAGDFDPSGEDIQRNFRVQMIDRGIEDFELHRIALTNEQVARFGLPEAPGKESDSRAGAFAERHGKLVQVELEALDPAELRRLYQDAIGRYWDDIQYAAVLEQEEQERRELLALLRIPANKQ
jgi:hypothetical protein